MGKLYVSEGPLPTEAYDYCLDPKWDGEFEDDALLGIVKPQEKKDEIQPSPESHVRGNV